MVRVCPARKKAPQQYFWTRKPIVPVRHVQRERCNVQSVRCNVFRAYCTVCSVCNAHRFGVEYHCCIKRTLLHAVTKSNGMCIDIWFGIHWRDMPKKGGRDSEYAQGKNWDISYLEDWVGPWCGGLVQDTEGANNKHQTNTAKCCVGEGAPARLSAKAGCCISAAISNGPGAGKSGAGGRLGAFLGGLLPTSTAGRLLLLTGCTSSDS